MKRKSLSTIILLLFIIPSIVLAKDTCNDNDIKIKSITLKELNGFSEEIQESTINNNTINLNLKMYDVGDSSTYDITVENTSNEDYYFTKDSMKLENDYLEYSLKNDSELIPAKEEKTIELKVSYKNQIPDNNYSDTSKLIISLSDKPLENPKTNISHNYLILIILLIVITIYVEVRNKSLSKNKLLLMISLLSTIPISINALCTVNLNVETKIEIENKEAIFLPGGEANIKMKELTGDDTSASNYGYNFVNETITSIKYSSQEPTESNKEEKNVVSTSDSQYPIYMWYEDGTIYWWSEDIHPSLNEDASYMYAFLKSLNDLSEMNNFDVSKSKNISYIFSNDYSLESTIGLENWDTSNVEKMSSVFSIDYSLKDISAIKSWNTSSVTDMSWFFYRNEELVDVSPIKDWDVSKVTNMMYMFSTCFSVEEIDLSNWKTDSLENMYGMFGMFYISNGTSYRTGGKLKKLILSSKFNTSKVIDMSNTFYNNRFIEDYSFLQYFDTSSVTKMDYFLSTNYKFNDTKYLKDWDTSNVKNMYLLFASNKELTDLSGLRNWNTSNVTNMERMFMNDESINDISAIKDWDVSKVTNYNYMFGYNTSLQDASPINNWNISKNSTFTYMFRNVPNHPDFTKVPGTWNSSGTFTPTP